MKIHQHKDAASMGKAASAQGAKVLRDVLAKKGRANIIVATGASQFETLKCLIKEPGIDWSKVTVFHLDEYVGLPESHGASFRKYLRERFISQLPAQPEFVPVDGDAAFRLGNRVDLAQRTGHGLQPDDGGHGSTPAVTIGRLGKRDGGLGKLDPFGQQHGPGTERDGVGG